MASLFDNPVSTPEDLEIGDTFITNELGPKPWTVTDRRPDGVFIAETEDGRWTTVPDNAFVFWGSGIHIYDK